MANVPSFRFDDRNVMNGFDLLTELDDRCARLVVFDPQYRQGLDHLDYGNEGKGRGQRRASLRAMTEHDIATWIEQMDRILRPSGHIALWCDKFIIGEGRQSQLLRYSTLRIVDLVSWFKCRPGMGRRTRCSTEYLVVAQKPPLTAKGMWKSRSFQDGWPEQVDRSIHTHAKPRRLTEEIVRAVTKRGDLVVDPCAGSYVVLDACRASGRRFVGCDLI